MTFCFKLPFNTMSTHPAWWAACGNENLWWLQSGEIQENRHQGNWGKGEGTIRARWKWTTVIAGGCCEISFDPSGKRLKKITRWQFCSASVKRLSSCRGHCTSPKTQKWPTYKEKELKRYSHVYYVSHLLQALQGSSKIIKSSEKVQCTDLLIQFVKFVFIFFNQKS